MVRLRLDTVQPSVWESKLLSLGEADPQSTGGKAAPDRNHRSPTQLAPVTDGCLVSNTRPLAVFAWTLFLCKAGHDANNFILKL